MFNSILVTPPDSYESEKGDFLVYIGSKESDVNPKADYQMWYEFTCLNDSPKEIQDGAYATVTWGKHINPLRKAVKAANDRKTNVRLVLMSKDHECDALGLALGLSECNIFKGKFTPFILETYYIKDIDIKAFVECLGLTSALVEMAKKFLPTKVQICNRYELMGNLTNREVIHLICEKHLKRDYGLIDYEVGTLDKPIKKVARNSYSSTLKKK